MTDQLDCKAIRAQYSDGEYLDAYPGEACATILALCGEVDAQAADIERLRAALVDLGAAYHACNGEDHPAHIAARAAIVQKEGD